MSDAGHPPGSLPVHRSEALTDGIFAVAMTLLVIELKLPDHHLIRTQAELGDALIGLMPRVYAWFVSFFVLALFWLGNHRAFAYVRRTDPKLVALMLFELAFVSLMPFSCALIGEYSGLLSQVIYSFNMSMLGLAALLVSSYIRRHPELTPIPMPVEQYRGARLRIVSVMVVSVLAVVIAYLVPLSGIGNVAFSVMAFINPLSRVLERRALARRSLVEASARSPA